MNRLNSLRVEMIELGSIQNLKVSKYENTNARNLLFGAGVIKHIIYQCIKVTTETTRK